MEVRDTMKEKLGRALRLQHLDIVNESHMHAGPARDSHFKLTIVADEFEALSAVKRHQRVYGVLKEELQGPVHALALHTYSPAEWQAREDCVPASPDCKGGS